jgi:hypothetical protein
MGVAASSCGACNGRSSSTEIGEEIGTAKGVDRLLRIADEHQSLRRVGEESSKDVVLDRIGVLELVDQRRAELPTDGRDQRRSLRACKRGLGSGQHVVEGQQLAFRFQPGQTLGREIQPIGAQGRDPRHSGLIEGAAAIEEIVVWIGIALCRCGLLACALHGVGGERQQRLDGVDGGDAA